MQTDNVVTGLILIVLFENVMLHWDNISSIWSYRFNASFWYNANELQNVHNRCKMLNVLMYNKVKIERDKSFLLLRCFPHMYRIPSSWVLSIIYTVAHKCNFTFSNNINCIENKPWPEYTIFPNMITFFAAVITSHLSKNLTHLQQLEVSVTVSCGFLLKPAVVVVLPPDLKDLLHL